MPTTPCVVIGHVLRHARTQQGLRQTDIAERCGVAISLVRDVELGRRPDVSLQIAMDLLGAVGVRLDLVAPDGSVLVLQSPTGAAHARAARAAHRRATWTGSQRSLATAGEPPVSGSTPVERLAAVTAVSRAAHALAAAPRARGRRRRAE